MLVQRQPRPAVGQAGIGAERGGSLHREIVRRDCRDAGVGDPFLQPLVVTVEHRALRLDRIVQPAVGVADELAEAGMDAENVALFHGYRVVAQNALEQLPGNVDALVPEMVAQVDHDAAPLHAGLGHACDRQIDRTELPLRAAAVPVDDLEAVVEHFLGNAVAVGVKL